MTPQPMKAGVCAEKCRLSEELQCALNDFTHLRSAESEHLIGGGSGLPGIELALQEARSKWEKAKRAYVEHLRNHGC